MDEEFGVGLKARQFPTETSIYCFAASWTKSEQTLFLFVKLGLFDEKSNNDSWSWLYLGKPVDGNDRQSFHIMLVLEMSPLLYKQIDCILPLVYSFMDQCGRPSLTHQSWTRVWLVCHFSFRTPFWRHLWHWFCCMHGDKKKKKKRRKSLFYQLFVYELNILPRTSKVYQKVLLWVCNISSQPERLNCCSSNPDFVLVVLFDHGYRKQSFKSLFFG